MTEYNGWTNHATWCVNLHITNSEASQRKAEQLKKLALANAATHENVPKVWTIDEARRFLLADALKEWIYDVTVEQYRKHGDEFAYLLRLDLITGYLDDVNWTEIAASMLA